MKYSLYLFFVSILFLQLSYADLVTDSSFTPRVTLPTFTNKHPVICFDLGHLNAKATDGRYEPVLGLLKSDGYEIKYLKDLFSKKSLDECQILYISAAMSKHEDQSAFTKDEIDSVFNWVIAGGSLLLMTDHPTNLSQAPEKLANAFEVYGSQGTVNDNVNTPDKLNDPTVIIFKDKNINPHSSIILGRNANEHVKKVIAFTGQSLQGPKESEQVLLFSDSSYDAFKNNQPKKSAQGKAEVIALKKGSGRVIVSGDGTMFTSKIETKNNEKYGINRSDTGNVIFALNVFHWLAKVIN